LGKAYTYLSLRSAELMNEVFQLLRVLRLQQGDSAQAAERQLRELERVPGFSSVLLEIGFATTADDDIRQLAFIVFKNSVDRCWRPNSDTCVKPEDREQIKNRLMSNLCEPNKALAVQLALIMRRISRFEWPQAWPNLFPVLAQTLENPSKLAVQRGLYTMYQVLLELNSKCRASAKRQFEEACRTLIGPVRQCWAVHTQIVIRTLGAMIKGPQLSREDVAALTESAELSLLSVKCLRTIVVCGIPDPDENAHLEEFFQASRQAIAMLLALYSQIPDAVIQAKVGKIMIRLFRIAADTMMERPLQFGVKYLIPFLTAAHHILAQHSLDARGHLIFEGMTVQALSFFSKVLIAPAYQSKAGMVYSAAMGLKFDHQKTEAVKAQLGKVFEPDYLTKLATLLITRFLVLRDDDLQSWQDTPEEFLADEQLMRADDKIRPATEVLMTNLFKRFPSVIVELCVQMVRESFQAPLLTQCPPRGSPQYQHMLVKEALYLVVGLGSFELEELFPKAGLDFNRWYMQVISKEINCSDPGLMILRRRAMWMVGEWVGQIPDPMKPPLYQDVCALLSQPDLVVRVTTASALQRMVEDMSFVNFVDTFLPHMNGAFELLFRLLKDCRLLDTRMQIMSAIRALVEAIGEKVAPAVGILLVHLPHVWEHCQDQNLLRPSILVTLQLLVQALKGQSEQLHGFLVHVIQFCTVDTTRSDSGVIAEPALELWHSVMQYAPSMTPALLGLFPNWLNYVNTSMELLEIAMGLLESYVLLGRESLMTPYARPISEACHSLLTRASDQGVVLVANVLETIAQIYPHQFPPLFGNVLNLMLNQLIIGVPATVSFTSGHTQPTEEKSTEVLLSYLHVMARLMFMNWNTMKEAFANMSQGSSAMLCAMLNIWVSNFDYMTLEYKRKVSVLAMLQALESADENVLVFLESILMCATTVLREIEEPTQKDEAEEAFAFAPSFKNEAARVTALVQEDPSSKIDLRQAVLGALNALSARLGPQAFAKAMGSVNPVILQDLNPRQEAAVFHGLNHG
jgi:hypothetical protein